MFSDFETYLQRKGPFTAEEFDLIRSLCTEKKFRRRQFLLTEGEICRHKIFVCRGLLRNYGVKEDGTEHVIRFVAENEWTTDPESFNNQTPSRYHIEALEHAEVILWTRENVERLLEAIPAFKSMQEQLYMNSISAIQHRMFKQVSYTAEEKYRDFISTSPQVFGRVPLEMVASYLGVSRKTLTRIRHAEVQRSLS